MAKCFSFLNYPSIHSTKSSHLATGALTQVSLNEGGSWLGLWIPFPFTASSFAPDQKNINRFPKLVNTLLFAQKPFAKFLPHWVWSYIKSPHYKSEEGAGTQETQHNKSVHELGIHPTTQPIGFPAGFQPQRFRAIPLVSLQLHLAICRYIKGRLLLKLALN